MRGRIYTQKDHRRKVRGMNKGELILKVKRFAKEKLDLDIPLEFLRQFLPTQLYTAMRAAQGGENHVIFTKWRERDSVVQTSLPF